MAQVSKIFRPLTVAIAIATLLSGCGESSSSSAGAGYGDKDTTPPTKPDTTFNQTALLANLTDNVITPTYQEFNSLAIAHQQAVANYCTTEQSYDSSQSRDSVEALLSLAQSSWQQTMDLWQQIEVMKLGPLITNSSILSSNIYSWPASNSCSVDQDSLYFAAGNINGTPYDISRRTPTRRGLDSLEYLLYNTSLEHSCSATTPILESWATMNSEQRRVTRCNFATEVSSDLVNNSQILLNQWLGDDGFAANLKLAGNPGSTFATTHEGVNAISDALFYLDKMTKDQKLGTPLGICSNCPSGIAPQSVESAYSNNSINNLINNIKGFQKILLGQGTDANNSLGFDDFLVEQKDSATSEDMTNQAQEAITQFESFEQTLAKTLVSNPEKVESAHVKVKAITDKLKTDFITSLALELPETSAGDND